MNEQTNKQTKNSFYVLMQQGYLLCF